MTQWAALAAGSLALALVVPFAAKAQGESSADGWQSFEGTWSVSGQRSTIPTEGGAAAAVVQASGEVVLAKAGGLGRGFRGEVVTFDDGQGVSVGRAVWTDEHGDRLFSTLKGEPLATGKRIIGTITGGTGRYASLEGEYSFTWQYVLSAGDGTIQGRAVGLQGRARRKGATP
jgi:hypothetical protein